MTVLLKALDRKEKRTRREKFTFIIIILPPAWLWSVGSSLERFGYFLILTH